MEGAKMLILTRKTSEALVIGDDVRVVVIEVKGQQVRMGIEAPDNVNVRRSELPPSTRRQK